MRLLLISVVLSLTATITFAQGKRYTDTDWNTTFVDSCGLPSPKSLQHVSVAGDQKLRFTLRPGDKGKCSTDNRRRHSAPYWERAELSQKSWLKPGHRHRISAEITFERGFTGQRETFFQIHGWARNCKRASPPVMMKFTDGKLRIETLRGVTGTYPGDHRNVLQRDVNVASLYGKQVSLTATFDMTTRPTKLSVTLGGRELLKRAPVEMAQCAVPHIKFGIYRPGAQNAEVSTLIYDDVQIRQLD